MLPSIQPSVGVAVVVVVVVGAGVVVLLFLHAANKEQPVMAMNKTRFIFPAFYETKVSVAIKAGNTANAVFYNICVNNAATSGDWGWNAFR